MEKYPTKHKNRTLMGRGKKVFFVSNVHGKGDSLFGRRFDNV